MFNSPQRKKKGGKGKRGKDVAGEGRGRGRKEGRGKERRGEKRGMRKEGWLILHSFKASTPSELKIKLLK